MTNKIIKTMEGAPKYQPSEEEIEKAEESMTEEQEARSEIREESLSEGGKRVAWEYLAAEEGSNRPEFSQEEEKVLGQFNEQKIRKGDYVRFTHIDRSGERVERLSPFMGITKNGMMITRDIVDIAIKNIESIKNQRNNVN